DYYCQTWASGIDVL
nr:immunoglobulin light chain junction region [Macaca mulatta]MOY15703.1 immunoglobulin light chain junction region [Macaca mulatta]MOY15885.1 immunoglobulin light chain junction region [Macaca mulatta]